MNKRGRRSEIILEKKEEKFFAVEEIDNDEESGKII